MKTVVILMGVMLMLPACLMQPQDIPIGVKKALKKAGENRIELETVIMHYKERNDTLKLKAAYFLIENMPGKYSVLPKNENDKYKLALDFLPSDPIGWDPTLSKTYQYFDSIKVIQKTTEKIRIYDLDVITSKYLIQNIDLAFEAWERYKKSNSYTFEDFCNYVLPYRDGYEPLDNWRKKGFNNFNFLLDSLSSPLDIAKYIVPNLKVFYNIGMAQYPYPLSFEEIKHTERGSCEHLSFYLTQSLRAIGIPAATEIIPVWANRSSGHRWNVVKDTTGRFVDIGFGPNAVNSVSYKISKIYRQVYQIQKDHIDKRSRIWTVFDHPDWKDVTSEYDMPLSDVCITSDRKDPTVYLCTFNNTNWIPVAQSLKSDTCCFFKSLSRGILFGENSIAEYKQEGKGIVYLPMTTSVFRLKAIAPAFILKENGQLKFLKPDHSRKRIVRLHRKYPQYSHIAIYSERMKNGFFEYSNTSDFGNKKIVHCIAEIPLTSVTEVKVHPSFTCRYIRYIAPDSSWVNIGELSFYSDSAKISGIPFASQKTSSENLNKAFDNNLETYYSGEEIAAYIGLDFKKEVTIDKIVYSPRTDNNDVFSGDEYELFYWEDTWRSLGKKVAIKYWLTYDNVPENTLLLLQNHTRGKEERIFTYENDTQVWW